MNFINFLFKSLVFFSLCITVEPLASGQSNPAPPLPRFPDSYFFRLPQSIRNEVILDVSWTRNGSLIILTDNRICINNGENWDFLSREGINGICSTGMEKTFLFSAEGVYELIVDSSFNYRLNPLHLKHTFQGESLSQVEMLGDRFLVSTGDNLFLLNDSLFTDISRGKDSIRILPAGEGHFFVHKTGSGYLDPGGEYHDLQSTLSPGDKVCLHPSGFMIYREKERKYLLLDTNFHILDGEPSFPQDIDDMVYLGEDCFVFLLPDGSITIVNTHQNLLFSMTPETGGSLRKLHRILDIPGSGFWILDDRSIRVVRYPDKLYRAGFPDDMEQVNEVLVLDDHQYVAGNKGIFLFPEQESIVANKPVYKIHEFKGSILFLSDDGLYRYRNGMASLWVEGLFSDFVCDTASSTVILKGENNLYLLDASNPSSLKARKLIRDFNYLEYLVSNSRLYYVTPRGFRIINLKRGNSEEILFPDYIEPLRIINTLSVEDQILLFSNKDVWIFDPQKLEFFADSSLRLPCQIREIDKLDDETLLVREHRADAEGYYRILNTGLREINHFRLPDYIGENYPPRIFATGGKELLVSGYRGNWILDPSPETDVLHPLILNELVFGSDTLFLRGNFADLHSGIRHKLRKISPVDNHLFLRFSLPSWTGPVNEYQLGRAGESGDPEWSHWFQGNYLYMEDLDYGEHTLLLRARSGEGNLSETVELGFRIRPPFYLKWWAILFYAVSALILLFYFYKIYSLRILNVSRGGEEVAPPRVIKPGKSNRESGDFLREREEIAEEDPDLPKRSRWEKFEMVTVLFSDIQGFTKIAEQMNPEVLIDELDRFFFHFDSVVGKHNIEKIKTIGDAYMAAGGIPVKNSTNPIQVILAAMEVQLYMKELKKSNTEIWELRIGIHTGPVIAGIVGQKKRSYDIWGDTVNTASRMESSGQGGKINISGVTYNLVKEYFICQYRGKLPVKYKGNIDMYFVKGLRPELSINLAGLPNRKFYLKLQLLRLQDLEAHVFEKLDEELPKNMYFHNSAYARHLYEHSHLLAKAENLDMEETLMIRTAALLLHLGYINSYANPENESAAIARTILPEFQYTSKQINTISNLILATKWPPEPKTLLEKIMVDTRMEYLGRADFSSIFRLLFLEINELSGPLEFRSWKENMIKLLDSFSFFTYAGRRLCEVEFAEQIRELEKLEL